MPHGLDGIPLPDNLGAAVGRGGHPREPPGQEQHILLGAHMSQPPWTIRL